MPTTWFRDRYLTSLLDSPANLGTTFTRHSSDRNPADPASSDHFRSCAGWDTRSTTREKVKSADAECGRKLSASFGWDNEEAHRFVDFSAVPPQCPSNSVLSPYPAGWLCGNLRIRPNLSESPSLLAKPNMLTMNLTGTEQADYFREEIVDKRRHASGRTNQIFPMKRPVFFWVFLTKQLFSFSRRKNMKKKIENPPRKKGVILSREYWDFILAPGKDFLLHKLLSIPYVIPPY